MIIPNNSVLLIDKPLHWSSFDVIRYLKMQFRKHNQQTPIIEGEKKTKLRIGHAGTLDPLATGLLIVCTGKETKNINMYQNQEKEYIAEVTFGATTQSCDSEFEPENFSDASGLTCEKIVEAVQAFIGDIAQTPPLFSAVKINGRRAYDLARSGNIEESEKLIKKRIVRIYSITIDPETFYSYNHQEHTLLRCSMTIRCGKGTYIRSLARDLGIQLGTGAYLSALRRTQIGNFQVENAISLAEADFVPSTLR